jgi:hypothetical protein
MLIIAASLRRKTMSKAIDLITINTVCNADNPRDIERLGSFLLALSRTDLEERGACGAAKVVPYGSDYKAVFTNGSALIRSTPAGSLLFRQAVCPADGCGTRTLSRTRGKELCPNHIIQSIVLDERIADVA